MRGLIEISTIKDAQDAWESFFGRFFSPEIPPNVNVDFDPTLREFTPRKNQKAKYNHPSQIEERTDHSDDFDDFLNGNTITIPDDITLNSEDLGEVEKAITNGDFAAKVMNMEKKEHTFYALWLFKQNKITRQQMTTILAMDQFPEEYPVVKRFRILNDKGEFTNYALTTLIPTLARDAYGEKITELHLQRLRLLIQALPKSERIFYISEINPEIINHEKSQLGNAILRVKSWYRATYGEKIYDLHLSFGVIEGLEIAKHGVNSAIANRAKMGKINREDVKEGAEFFYRPTAISMRNSGVEETTAGIHGYAYTPMPAVTAHDTFHSRLNGTIRPEFHIMLNHMNQIIQKHTKLAWSKSTWELTDREFHAFQLKGMHLISAQKGASIFKDFFHQESHEYHKDKGYFFRGYPHKDLSDDGFAIVWHMINNKDVWKKLYKVDVDSLSSPYKPLIKQMQSFKEQLGDAQQHPKILTLKYRFFRVTSPEDFKKICMLIDSLENKLLNDKGGKRLVFGKYTINKDNDNDNLVVLKLQKAVKSENEDKDLFITEQSVKQVLPILITMHLETTLGKEKPKKVEAEVTKLSTEFKSQRQQSNFSKEVLDNAVDSFSSLRQKLDFLAACYEKITTSKTYTRQHAFLDNMFAFLKNPFTTSQRKHIALLQQKLHEIINDYSQENNLSKEEQEELQWYIKNLHPQLASSNTDRFQLHFPSTKPS